MAARILIVEDNPANLQLMSYLLKSFKHLPLVARDGEEGLEMVRREPLDLIICDLQLPKLDGYAFARQLRSDPALAKIPLVAVTAYVMVGDRDKVMAAGFDDYISKPIVPRTFVSQVEAFLRPQLRSATLPPTSARDRDSIALPKQKRATVLVVDDLPVNITLARRILEPSGYPVIAAGSVKEALALARANRPHLILSDLHMPDGDGHDLIQAVKADPQLQAIPFILISSSKWKPQGQRDALARGAARFLVRPIEPQALLSEIEACLSSQQETEAWRAS